MLDPLGSCGVREEQEQVQIGYMLKVCYCKFNLVVVWHAVLFWIVIMEVCNVEVVPP